MKNLPEEVLVEIFSFLSPSDLLNLTLTCKSFNKIVSETNRLCSRLTIYLKQPEIQFSFSEESTLILSKFPLPPPEFINYSNRKYRKVAVYYFDEGYFGHVLGIIGNDIQDVKIYKHRPVLLLCDSLELKDIFRLLEMCKNVRILSLGNIQFTNEDTDLENIPQLNHLVDIKFLNVDQRILGFFGNCKCRRLTFKFKNFMPISYIKHFLLQQELLEDLTLIGNGHLDDDFSKVKFRLKRLLIKNSYMDTSSLYGFLDLHAATLECLTTSIYLDRQFSMFINSCKVLKELNIKWESRMMFSKNLEPVPKVTKLVLDFINYSIPNLLGKLVLEKFSGFKVLELRNYIGLQDEMDEDLTGVQIEELTIKNSLIRGFYKIPSLKKLHLRNKSRIFGYKVYEMNPQIEELTIDDSKLSEAELMEVRRRLTNLKYFKKFDVEESNKTPRKKMRC